MRKERAVVNLHAVGKGIVMERKSGHGEIKGKHKDKNDSGNFDELKCVLVKIRNVIQMPAQLIVNWDQTGIRYIATSIKLDHGASRIKMYRDCWQRS